MGNKTNFTTDTSFNICSNFSTKKLFTSHFFVNAIEEKQNYSNLILENKIISLCVSVSFFQKNFVKVHSLFVILKIKILIGRIYSL
jgi:hypothetical protein